MAVPPPPHSVSYHTIYANAAASSIQPVLDLNKQIFAIDTSNPPSHHGTLSEWQKRLDDPLSIIAYATLPSPASDSSNAPVVGFILAHPKRHPNHSGPALHIWLAGVLPASRGTGTFHGLMKLVEEHARQQSVRTLSVATFPAKFEKMYSILTKTGWESEQDLGEGKVLLMKELS